MKLSEITYQAHIEPRPSIELTELPEGADITVLHDVMVSHHRDITFNSARVSHIIMSPLTVERVRQQVLTHLDTGSIRNANWMDIAYSPLHKRLYVKYHMEYVTRSSSFAATYLSFAIDVGDKPGALEVEMVTDRRTSDCIDITDLV